METEKIRAGKNRAIYSLSDVPLCQETPNKEGATVITPIFTPGIFSECRHAKRDSPNQAGPDPTRAHHIKYSQEGAYLERQRFARKDSLQPAATWSNEPRPLSKKVHFSYHTCNFPDRQELLRSSRNLDQKTTPWHKEHSNGPCSQDHIFANPKLTSVQGLVPLESRQNKAVLKNFRNFPTDVATLARRVFLTRNKLIHKPGHVGKKTHSCTTWNSRIAKNFTGSSRNPDRKTVLKRTKNTSGGLYSRDHISRTQARIPTNPEPCKSRQRKLSDGTKNVKIRHRELGQIRARTGTRFKKKARWEQNAFFPPGQPPSRAESFLTRYKLIREPGCVGKIMTPATTWNSRFADSIPRLTGIFAGKTHKNSSGTPTSGSHNSLVRTPIRVNFILLERGRRELSDDMLHDPF
uniref:Uncharacterized protein n=1 Tax=Fagus sylvatica TaxID=28930 RepID=A0A2N9HE27_FAGSY